MPFLNKLNSLNVPSGFTIILEKLVIAILQEQPSNIVDFSAKLLADLVLERNVYNKGSMVTNLDFKHQASNEDDETKTILQKPISFERPAVIVQSAYRGYTVRKQLKKKLHDENAAKIIQKKYRNYKSKQRGNKSAPSKLEANMTEQMDHRNSSAVIIQSMYKGYLTRKEIRHHKKEQAAAQVIQNKYRYYKAQQTKNEDIKDKHINHLYYLRNEKAVIRIQSLYRGYTVRKKKNTGSIKD